MRRTTICLLIVVSFASTLAQAPDRTPPDEDPSVWGRAHHPYLAVLCASSAQNSSVPANEAETAQSCGKHPILIFRDDAGRVRREGFADVGILQAVQIDDPQTGLRTIFYPARKTALRVEAPKVHPLRPPDVWTIEALPEKTIAGIKVPGQRFTRTMRDGNRTGTLIIEDWTSFDLGIVLEHDVHSSWTGSHREVVTALDLSNPNASLFTLPDGYTLQAHP